MRTMVWTLLKMAENNELAYKSGENVFGLNAVVAALCKFWLENK